MATNDTLVCSLSGPALIERISDWQQVASKATTRHVDGGRVVSTYPNEQDLLQRLRRLIAAEADCCPFMQFDVEEGPEQVTVELRVPDEMGEVLTSMLGLVM